MRGLTIVDPKLERAEAETPHGMAHWAGSGPKGKSCRQCISWDNCGADPGYYAAGGKHRGALKPRSCRKYQELMAGEIGPAVPHNAAACKYFSENTAPPPITARSA